MTGIRDALLTGYARTPEHPGKYRLVQLLGRHVFPAEGIVATVHGGTRLQLHPGDWIEYELLRSGRYEPLTLQFLSQNLRAGDTAVLAGINNGLHAIVAAKAAGAGGRVIGIDPQPRALLRARDNADLNGVGDRLQLVAAGLGATRSLQRMAWPDPGNHGAASLLDAGAGPVVVILPLADLLDELRIERVRLLLLDVQGYEAAALEGLSAHQPDLVVVEISDEYLERAGTTRAGVFDALLARHYRLFDLAGRPVTATSHLPEINVVACRDGVPVSWIEM